MADRPLKKNELDYFFDLHTKGFRIPDDKLQLLRENNYFTTNDKSIYSGDKNSELVDVNTENEDEAIASLFTDVIRGGKKTKHPSEIKKSDWMPHSVIVHSEEFVKWIDSLNSGFQNMVYYEPFDMYCKQSEYFLSLGDSFADCDTYEEEREFAFIEFDRFRENSLYFLDKYVDLKEGDSQTGSLKYTSKPVHKVIAFLFDCGYSVIQGKPRQIAATTTYGALALCKIISSKNFFIKMVAQDKDKVEEIFNDKIKYPFSSLPSQLKPSVSNDRDNLLAFAKKQKKGSKTGLNTKFQVVAPSIGAINGGSPNIVFVDEAGYIPILGKMIKEARPTMFWENPQTKLMEMKRQIVIWGTGGLADVGGKAYEEEYYDAVKKWKERKWDYGIIPIFFDWSTRPGITKEHYENEKKNYTVEGPNKDDMMVQFRQAYPARLEDMFLTSHKTLISIDYIERQLDRMYEAYKKTPEIRCSYGYFEPIFDETKPAGENSDVPFQIIGSEFIECEEGDSRVTSIMYMRPKRNWIDRYCSGTDPIASDSGYSKFAKTIWDKWFNCPVCIVNYRESNHKYAFLQAMLAGIHYDTHGLGSAPELPEANIGQAYIDYCDSKGFYRHFVYRTELPPYLQGGGHAIGIDNKGARNRALITKMLEVFDAFGDKFWIPEIYLQARTFVCKVNNKGNETWEPIDRKKYNDDILWSLVFAYICSLCYDHRTPKEITSESDMYRSRWELYRLPDGTLTRVEKKIPINGARQQ